MCIILNHFHYNLWLLKEISTFLWLGLSLIIHTQTHSNAHSSLTSIQNIPLLRTKKHTKVREEAGPSAYFSLTAISSHSNSLYIFLGYICVYTPRAPIPFFFHFLTHYINLFKSYSSIPFQYQTFSCLQLKFHLSFF
jgi:hypothetical protein